MFFILKNGENQTKNPAITNIKRHKKPRQKRQCFTWNARFCQEKRHFLIQTIKGCSAFQAWVLAVFHAFFAKASAARPANVHFIGWKRLVTRRTFHNIYRLFLILLTAIIPKKTQYIPCPENPKVIHKTAPWNLHGERTKNHETKR